MSATTGCIPVNVNFNVNPSANTQSVICDLGDGTLYTDSLNFNYSYNSVNIFHPKFILTDQIGCSVAYSLDSIATHALPVLNLRDTSICAGQNVKVVLGNDQYQWSNLPVSSCSTCSTVTLHPMDTTDYKVIATSTTGCSVTNRFKIMVDQLPVLKAQDTIKICQNGTVTMDVVESAFGVNWSPSTYLNNAHAFAPLATPAENMNYIVTAYNRLGCSLSQIVPVNVYNKIPFSVTADTAVCPGSSVQLNVMTTDTLFHNVTYTWNTSTDLSATDIANPIATVRSNAETFRVTAHSGNCPATSAAVTVTVNPAAHVKLPTEIVTTANAEVTITPTTGNLTTYNWSAKEQLSCTDCAATSLVPTENQIVYVHGTNQYGCTAKDSTLIHILNCDPNSVFIPNTFTPNTDGTNDKLYVRSKTLAQLEYFRLFNRWGAIVFETKNIAEGWDGNINGQIAEEGVYVYQMSGKCESGYDVSTSGTVTLVR
jgi:gliding motility-associated-like protein